MASVAGSVLGGDANVANYVDSLYQKLLGRTADSGGECYWVSRITSGASPSTIITNFLTCEENIRDTVGTYVTWTDLSHNLSLASAGTETATGAGRLAASYTTGSSTTTLTAVTLLLEQAAAGTAVVPIFSDGGLRPGTLVGTMTSPRETTGLTCWEKSLAASSRASRAGRSQIGSRFQTLS